MQVSVCVVPFSLRPVRRIIAAALTEGVFGEAVRARLPLLSPAPAALDAGPPGRAPALPGDVRRRSVPGLFGRQTSFGAVFPSPLVDKRVSE